MSIALPENLCGEVEMRHAATKLSLEYRRHGREVSEASCRKRIAKQMWANGLGARETMSCMVVGLRDSKGSLAKYGE